MRLLSLSVSNWACHRSLEVDLSRGLQIEGRNGTGKSSILKAIRFAFAGTAAGYRSRIANGERSAEVELSFTKEGKRYDVRKVLHVDKPSEARLTCEGALVADNASSVAEALGDILPEEVLDDLLYVPQGEVTGIIDRLAQKGGRQELDALFGLDRLERVYKACGDLIKEADAKVRALSEQLPRYPEDAEKEFAEQLRVLSGELQGLDSERRVFHAKRAELSSQLKLVDEEVSELKRRRDEKEVLKDQLRKLELSLAGQDNRMKSLRGELEGLSEKKAEFSSLKDRVNALKHYAEMRGILARHNALKEQLSAVSSVEDERGIRELEERLADKGKVAELLRLSEQEARSFGQIALEAEVELARQREYLEGLTELPGKVKCPRCGQFLDKGHVRQEIQFTKREIKKFVDRVTEVREKEPALKGRTEELTKILEELKENEFELKHLNDALTKKRSESERLVREIDEAAMKLEVLGYRGEEASAIEEYVAEYNALKGKADFLERDLQKEGKIRKELAEAEADHIRSSKMMEETTARFGGILFDQKSLDEKEKARSEVLERKYSVDGMIKEAEFRISEKLMRQKDAEEKRGKLMELKGKRDEAEARLHILSRARDVFHTDKGLPKYLRDKYIKTLGATLTGYFRRFNQNPTYKEVCFDKDYRMQVKATHGELAVEQLSGGEKVQLAVALRIALIEMLSPMRILILDEPFGSLDIEHRELLGETLNKMAVEWQLILVTHVHVDSLQLETMQLEGY